MKYNTNEISALQQLIKAGDIHAFERLYKLMFPGLHQFCAGYVGQPEAAEEIVNDIMLRQWLQRTEITAILHLPAYLFTAVRNASLNHLRSRSGMMVVLNTTTDETELQSCPTPEEHLEWKDQLARFQQFVDGLPTQSRQIFKLVKEEGFLVKEAAAILGLSPRTVETQLYRAFKKMTEVFPDMKRPAKK